MTTRITALAAYADDRGNVVEFAGRTDARVEISFTGSGNRLVVASEVRLAELVVHFNCDAGFVEIGPSRGVPAFSANMRVGQDARIVIGRDVSSTSRVGFSAVEGASVVVGDDVMFASENQVRSDDGHPIFDVGTGRRVNPALSITIGHHVWVGWGAVVLGGTTIGDGTVVGMGSIVKGRHPNNCVVAGSPARVVRRDVAWERPHLSLVAPYYKPDASTVTRSPYWHRTVDDPDTSGGRRVRSAGRQGRSLAVRALRGAARRGLGLPAKVRGRSAPRTPEAARLVRDRTDPD
jgi:acetyltransferase-like isoleucine patch superfamily enzyme